MGLVSVFPRTNDQFANIDIGWVVPFIWAAIWAAITVPWVRATLRREAVNWEESSIISDTIKPNSASQAAAHGPTNMRPSEASTSDPAVGQETT